MSLKAFAEKLPDLIKQPLRYIYRFVPPSIRYSKVFWQTYNFLQESQWWSREKLEEYQMQQISRLLRHAYKNVPYYRKVFDERGLKPEDIQSCNDLKKLSFTTKEIIRDHLTEFVAQNIPKSKLKYVTTGGSTGIPFGFYDEKGVSDAKEWAFMLTQWNRVGFKMGDRCVVLRGNVVRTTSRGKFWEYDPISKDLILSSYYMTDETLPKYISKIRRFKPRFIQAYPSTIIILVRFIKENKVEPFSGIKAVLCGSENLYPWQRQLLEQVFQCRVYSWYGHAEKAVLAGECEYSPYYHIFPEYGYVELIGPDGSDVNKEDETGEIVSTGFNNYATPFIRYKTEDLGVYTREECTCGRNYSMVKRVEGRIQEFIVTKDGSLLPHMSWAHDMQWSGVKQIQFLQEKPGALTIKVVKSPHCSNAEIKAYILGLYAPRFEGLCEVNVVFVNYIPRTNRGKYQFLIQKLPITFNK